jgi:chemotaxis protein CheX
MDVAIINPFITATVDTFKAMLSMDLQTGKPSLKNDAKHTYDVSGVIGLSGDAQGVISISFPKVCALKVVSALIGMDLKIIGPDLTDGVGELANIVAGNAKQYLTQYKLSISLPNVVIGTGHRIAVPSGVPTIIVPLSSKLGDFAMEVALKTR